MPFGVETEIKLEMLVCMNVSMHEFFIAFLAIFSVTLILSFWLGGWPFIPAGALFVYIIARLDK